MISRIRPLASLALLSAALLAAAPLWATVYVVDQTAPNAADANPGTEEKPFKTVQKAADLAQPGDTVYVLAGRYDERVKVAASGTAAAPITFRAMPRRAAIVNGFDLPGSHLRVTGFEITAAQPAVAVVLSGSHCTLTDNYIHDMTIAISGAGGKAAADGSRDYSSVAHHRIAYNKVYHTSFGFVLGGSDWLVENNEVSRLFMYGDPNRKNGDCDYTRFFGDGCIQRNNYYHGSTREEIRSAHVDCLQTFTNNGEHAKGLLFEDNTCFDFHQACMVESAPHIGNVANWTFRRNIMSTNSPTLRGGWGPDIIQTLDVTIENNTIVTVNWAAIGLRGPESTGGQIRNNILSDAERAVVDGDKSFAAAKPVMEFNLTFKTAPLAGPTNINGKDPLFVDAPQRNFRLQKGTPAAGAGKDGATVGALEYPNVYYVDPRHPAAADEPAWGYPGVPLATLSKAVSVAQAGETVVLRGGVYRETLRGGNPGVTVRAAKGEKVILCRSDVVAGWKRDGAGWWAPLAAAPKQILRDGQAWTEYTYDAAAKRVRVKTGGDPRLHLFETVVRELAMEPGAEKAVKMEGVTVAESGWEGE